MVKNDKNIEKVRHELMDLSHFLGSESYQLAILGEGNSSAKVIDESGEKTFLVKASGTCLATMKEDEFVHLKLESVMELLDKKNPSDEIIQKLYKTAMINPDQVLRPSVESLLHAICLRIAGVNFVGHTHPVSINILTCSDGFPENLKGRIYPDEIVVLGTNSIFVPYTDPGIPLAKEINCSINEFMKNYQQIPKVLYLQNHGLLALGSTKEEVKNITLTANKAAWIRIGALGIGNIHLLPRHEVKHIAGRLDEQYRQQFLSGEKKTEKYR